MSQKETAIVRTLMPDLDIEVIAETTGIPVVKVRGIVWLAEKHMSETCTVIEPFVDAAEPLDWDGNSGRSEP